MGGQLTGEDMSAARTVPVVIASYDHAFPWQVFAVGAVLLLLAFALRRTRWAAYVLLTCGAACVGGAALLWAAAFRGQA